MRVAAVYRVLADTGTTLSRMRGDRRTCESGKQRSTPEV
jgi:hypothetical protein